MIEVLILRTHTDPTRSSSVRADVNDLLALFAVRTNPSTPPELLAQLARDADARVRRIVAGHSSTLLEDL
jgi:hypothetical protein